MFFRTQFNKIIFVYKKKIKINKLFTEKRNKEKAWLTQKANAFYFK